MKIKGIVTKISPNYPYEVEIGNGKFSHLKVGDVVKLAKTCKEYSCGHKTPDGFVYIPSGQSGIVGAVKVPAIHNKRVFACVDFSPNTPLVDCKGKTVKHWSSSNHFRCAVFPDDLI